jgi:uncharacterized protein YpmB
MVTKKTVVILVIIAVILAAVSLGYTLMNPAQKVSTSAPAYISGSSSGSGQVGVIVNPPAIQDRSR